MGWKDWPSWVKGGVIGLIIGIIPIISIFVKPLSYGLVLWWPISKISSQIFSSMFGSDSMVDLITIYFSPIFYFLIGALIGWIVGKIKFKK